MSEPRHSAQREAHLGLYGRRRHAEEQVALTGAVPLLLRGPAVQALLAGACDSHAAVPAAQRHSSMAWSRHACMHAG